MAVDDFLYARDGIDAGLMFEKAWTDHIHGYPTQLEHIHSAIWPWYRNPNWIKVCTTLSETTIWGSSSSVSRTPPTPSKGLRTWGESRDLRWRKSNRPVMLSVSIDLCPQLSWPSAQRPRWPTCWKRPKRRSWWRALWGDFRVTRRRSEFHQLNLVILGDFSSGGISSSKISRLWTSSHPKVSFQYH